MYPGGQWVKVSHLICWLSQVNLIRQFVKRAEIQSRRLAWLRVCICFSFIFSLVVNLWWRREWKGNEKKKKKEALERISHSPHIHPWSWAAEITNHTTQIKRLSQLPQRKPFQKYILRALFSPNTAHHKWALLRGTRHSDLRINEKWQKVQRFPFYGVGIENDRTENQKPTESSYQMVLLPLWTSVLWFLRQNK